MKSLTIKYRTSITRHFKSNFDVPGLHSAFGLKHVFSCILSVVFFLSFTLSCTPSYNSLVKKAETLMYTDADSAFSVMDEAEAYISGDRDFSRWCMLWGKINGEYEQRTAQKKRFLPVYSWQRTLAYIDRKGTDGERAQARIYLGRAQKESGLCNEAFESYNAALNLALKTKNYALAGDACSCIADLYMDRDLTEDARLKYEENAEYQQEAGNLRNRAIALRDVSFCHILEENYDESLKYNRMADSIADILHDSVLKSYVLNNYGVMYEETGLLDSAEFYYLKSLDFDTADCDKIYYNLSEVHIKQGDIETSRKYLEKIKSDRIKRLVVYQKYLIAKEENNSDSALYYLERSEEIVDSVRTRQDMMYIAEMDHKYEKSRAVNEKNTLLVQLQRFYIIGSTLAAIAVAMFVLYRHRVRRRLRQHYELLMQKESEFRILSAQLNEKERLLSEVDKQSSEHTHYRKRVESIASELYEMKMNMLYKTEIGQEIMKFFDDDISPDKDKDKMSGEDWDRLESTIKNIFPDAYAAIASQAKRSSGNSFRLCLLAPFGLRTQDEALLMGKTEDAIRQNRSRLRKMFNVSDLKNIYNKTILP